MSVVESKSLLAKLLAEENISVQHKKANTAYFDVKNRVLVCPILKDMPAELYDLLMGHEVGHALYTPPEGWHNAVTKSNQKNFKSFLNIVEDARIEKRIKDKFPGIRSSFFKGYKNLFERGFFGVSEYTDISDLKLIDRINLHFKLGTLINVKFAAHEQKFVDMVDGVTTWEDVVRVAQALYDYAKNDEPETDINPDIEDLLDDLDLSDLGDEESDDEMEVGDGKDAKVAEVKKMLSNNYDNTPKSVTDEVFRRKESDLVDDQCKPIAYVNFPKINMKDRIVHEDLVHDNIKNHVAKQPYDLFSTFGVSIKAFLQKNERYVNYMVKEFELRKNAKQFARASVNKSGELDMKKIGQYKLTEDLFRRVTIVPQGKSHGLVMFLDLSGSMRGNFKGTVEQLLIVTTFCRKVNIPFEVYGFTDSAVVDQQDRENFPFQGVPLGERAEGNIIFYAENTFRLKRYLSSKMSRTKYNQAMLNLLLLGEMFQRSTGMVPATEHLNGTPLNEAVAASISVVNNFRDSNRLEIVTCMFLTDGEGQQTVTNYVCSSSTSGSPSFRAQVGSWDYRINITDPVTKHSVTVGDEEITKGLLMLAKKITGANYVGFFITDGSPFLSNVKKVHRLYGVRTPDNIEVLANKGRKEKFFPVMNTGFDVYFVVPGGRDLEVNDLGIEVDTSASKSDIRRAFMKSVNSRATNRVFLSRFCNTICAQL
jgi:hypothetical protein